ncbi:MAG: DUF4377 domain-containing protein [Flavobacteriaceae bacterium]
MKKFSLFCLLISLVSCGSLKQNAHIYWVNSSKTECSGVGEMTCLQVQKSDTLDFDADWNLFYSQIEGFRYVPGFIYKLNVKETPIENPPADASSIKYTLIKELEKFNDPRLAINDIWVLVAVGGVEVDKTKINIIPQIEINISKKMIIGTNGCNNISGSIAKQDATKIEFGPLRETMKMCPNMEIPNQFSLALTQTRFYKKENLVLKLFDVDMKELLSFKKVD